MRAWIGGVLAALFAVPGAASAQYQAPVNPPRPAAQLMEMLTIYEDVCLNTFPDNEEVTRRAEALGGVPMTADEVRRRLHEDPGHGWMIAGQTARFELTIEDPPYHACALRTMTAAGFPDPMPYQAVAQRYRAGHGRFEPSGTMDQVVGTIHVRGAGEQADLGGGRTDSLYVVMSDIDPAHRAPNETAVEVRFAHQLYTPPSR